MDFVEERMSLRSFVSRSSKKESYSQEKKGRFSFSQVGENEEDMHKNRADAKARPSRFKLRFHLFRVVLFSCASSSRLT